MISVFPLYTFRLYVAAFQQHHNMHSRMNIHVSDVKAYVVSRHFLDQVSVAANKKAIESGFLLVKSWLPYDRHHDVVDGYGLSVSHMTTYMFGLPQSQSSSSLCSVLYIIVCRFVFCSISHCIDCPSDYPLLSSNFSSDLNLISLSTFD
jgi:hypothetical protein